MKTKKIYSKGEIGTFHKSYGRWKAFHSLDVSAVKDFS